MDENEAVAIIAVKYWDDQIKERQSQASVAGGYEAWMAAIQSYILCTNAAHEMLNGFPSEIRNAIIGANETVYKPSSEDRIVNAYAQVSLEYTRSLPNVANGQLLTTLILDHTRIVLKNLIDAKVDSGKDS